MHEIPEANLAEFELAIATACALQSEIPLAAGIPPIPDGSRIALPDKFKDGTGSLILSFDIDWHPFLNNGRGHHVGERPRWYVPHVAMLQLVSTALQHPEEIRRASGSAGGRVFLSSSGVRRRLAGHPESQVLLWRLPRRSVLLG